MACFGQTSSMAAHTASCRASTVRGAARLIHAFILEKMLSIGLKSGL